MKRSLNIISKLNTFRNPTLFSISRCFIPPRVVLLACPALSPFLDPILPASRLGRKRSCSKNVLFSLLSSTSFQLSSASLPAGFRIHVLSRVFSLLIYLIDFPLITISLSAPLLLLISRSADTLIVALSHLLFSLPSLGSLPL